HPAIEAFESRPARVHRLAADPMWSKTVSTAFFGVRYRDLYPGIDLLYHAVGSKLKSEFVVAPGSDPSVIRIAYGGAESLSVDSFGTLIVRMSEGEMLRESGLSVFQGKGAGSTRVSGSFRIQPDGMTVQFAIGDYDRGRTLVIDPTLTFSTYLGGGRFDA